MQQAINIQDEMEEDRDVPQIRLPSSFRLGDRLVRSSLITKDQLHIALHEQRSRHEMLGKTLIRLGFVNEPALAQMLADHAGTETVDLRTTIPDKILVDRYTVKSVRERKALPIAIKDKTLTVAVTDPFDLVTVDHLLASFKEVVSVKLYVTTPSLIIEYLNKINGKLDALDGLLSEIELNPHTNVTALEAHPVIRLVDHLIEDAIKLKASDIHLEPEQSHVRVRFRLDGVLQHYKSLHLSHWSALSHRIKIMAGMNIADTRSIQDGRFQKAMPHGAIDFRVAIMPSERGETIVIRLLEQNKAFLDLDELGYSHHTLNTIKAIFAKPQGITLISGPTGSGKTTSLYSILNKLNTEDVHIATLEEPIEYQIEGIRQTAIHENSKVDFISGIRGLLRMDPDILLIGEIRDPETAQMALRAAMTGHRVFATLHCNDAIGCLSRLYDLGLKPESLSGNLSGFIAQRLVRNLCPYCKKTCPPSSRESEVIESFNHGTGHTLTYADGCSQCNKTGRMGRTVVAEAISVTESVDELIGTRATAREIINHVRKEHFLSLQQDGITKVLSHQIAFSDLEKAVDLSRGRP